MVERLKASPTAVFIVTAPLCLSIHLFVSSFVFCPYIPTWFCSSCSTVLFFIFNCSSPLPSLSLHESIFSQNTQLCVKLGAIAACSFLLLSEINRDRSLRLLTFSNVCLCAFPRCCFSDRSITPKL